MFFYFRVGGLFNRIITPSDINYLNVTFYTVHLHNSLSALDFKQGQLDEKHLILQNGSNGMEHRSVSSSPQFCAHTCSSGF